MNDDLRTILTALLREHGLRGLVNALADVIDEFRQRRENIPYWPGDPECSVITMDADDLETAAQTLRHTSLF